MYGGLQLDFRCFKYCYLAVPRLKYKRIHYNAKKADPGARGLPVLLSQLKTSAGKDRQKNILHVRPEGQ